MLSHASGRPSKDTAKTVRRGAPPPIRHGAVDTPQHTFDVTFDELARDLVTDPRTQARLKGYRDTIPFVAKRDSQQYLAAAILIWHLLVEVGRGGDGAEVVTVEKIKPKLYRAVADPILTKLLDSLAARRKEAPGTSATRGKGGKAEAGEVRPEEITLFRHVSMVIVSLSGRRG